MIRPTAALVDQLAKPGVEPAIEEQELRPLLGIQDARKPVHLVPANPLHLRARGVDGVEVPLQGLLVDRLARERPFERLNGRPLALEREAHRLAIRVDLAAQHPRLLVGEPQGLPEALEPELLESLDRRRFLRSIASESGSASNPSWCWR